jgi:hypothetical protein
MVGPLMVSGFVSVVDMPVPQSRTLARASRASTNRLDPEKTAVTDAPGAIGAPIKQRLRASPMSSEPGGQTALLGSNSDMMKPSSFVASHSISVFDSVAVSPTFVTVTRASTS